MGVNLKHLLGSALTDRERQVVQLMAYGHKQTAIGADLGISGRTVEIHSSRARHKLGARNPANMVYVATKLGIIE